MISSYSPWAEVAKMRDVVVGYVLLDDGIGWWEPDERVILLDRRLDRIGRRCTLAHELEHALAGDAACVGTANDGFFTTVMERRAASRAARKLIPLDALAESIALYDDDDHLIAAHLDVDLPTLDVRRATLQPAERRALRDRLARDESRIA